MSMDFDFGLPGLHRENQRPKRVAEAIGQELSLLLLHQARDPRLAGVVITRVEVTPDLKQATVFFSIPRGEQPAAALKALERARGFFRGHVAMTLNMRYTPQLLFRHDRAMDDLDNMERLLREIKQGERNDESDT